MQGKLSKRHPAHVSPVVPHEAEHVLVAALLSIRNRVSHPVFWLAATPGVWPQLWAHPRRPTAGLLVKKRDKPQAQVAWRPRRPQPHTVPVPSFLPGQHRVVHRQQGCPATGDHTYRRNASSFSTTSGTSNGHGSGQQDSAPRVRAR